MAEYKASKVWIDHQPAPEGRYDHIETEVDNTHRVISVTLKTVGLPMDKLEPWQVEMELARIHVPTNEGAPTLSDCEGLRVGKYRPHWINPDRIYPYTPAPIDLLDKLTSTFSPNSEIGIGDTTKEELTELAEFGVAGFMVRNFDSNAKSDYSIKNILRIFKNYNNGTVAITYEETPGRVIIRQHSLEDYKELKYYKEGDIET